MIPTLYDSGSINGKTLGCGKIVDAIRCEISESLNGEYSLELDYPVYGPMYNDLLGAKSIIAAGPNNDVEAFDIFKSSIPIDGVVTFYANHVSRRAAFQILTEDFVSGMSLHLVPQTVNGVRVGMTDSTGTTHRVNVAEPRPWLSAIVGDNDSLAAQGLEIEFITNFSPIDGTISVSGIAHNQRGSDNKAFVRFGANMVDIDYVTDETETYNAFLPFWTDGNGNVIKPTGNALAQPTTPITPIKAVPLDVTSAFQTQPTDSEMLTYATAILDSTTPWIAAKTVTVDMINGPEIDTHAVPVSMGDTVHVYWTDANINEEMRVVAYKYDVLGETYTEIKLGTPETEFVATTGETAIGGSGVVTSVNGQTGAVSLTAPNVGAMSKWALLWENASPTSAFAAQTINVDFSGYDMLAVCAYFETTNATQVWAFLAIPGQGRLLHFVNYRQARYFYAYPDMSKIDFGDGQAAPSGSTMTTSNANLIPWRIYGIKGVQ